MGGEELCPKTVFAQTRPCLETTISTLSTRIMLREWGVTVRATVSSSVDRVSVGDSTKSQPWNKKYISHSVQPRDKQGSLRQFTVSV